MINISGEDKEDPIQRFKADFTKLPNGSLCAGMIMCGTWYSYMFFRAANNYGSGIILSYNFLEIKHIRVARGEWSVKDV